MLYFILDIHGEEVLEVTSDFKRAEAARLSGDHEVTSRNDIEDFVYAENLAEMATGLTGEIHTAVDQGLHHYPRFDVIRVPHVGDEVSYAFNGDSYPCGTVTAITKSLRKVTTSGGRVFWRRKLSGAWVNNGTWSLQGGHVETRNPHI